MHTTEIHTNLFCKSDLNAVKDPGNQSLETIEQQYQTADKALLLQSMNDYK